MKNKFLTIGFALISILLAACSGSGGSNDNGGSGGNADPETLELGYSPKQRWPDVGDYSYSFRMDMNGSVCEAKEVFSNLADYCMGLQDVRLNDGCARSARKNSYKLNCGDDFQDINIPAEFYAGGFDSRLNQSCETASPQRETFVTGKQYCQFLKNEDLHKNCHWDSRSYEFKKMECKGDFSVEPKPVNTPPANPPANPPAKPPQDPPKPPVSEDLLDNVPAIRDIRAAGIEVQANWNAIRDDNRYNRPGEPSMQEKLRQLYVNLEVIKEDIIARKNVISSVEISSYSTYYHQDQSLIFNYEFQVDEAKEYFLKLDQLLRYEESLGIRFSGIHDHSLSGKAPIEEIIDVLEYHAKELKLIKGVISAIRFENYTSFYASSRELRLRKLDTIKEMASVIQKLKPLGPVFNWADKNQVELDMDFDIEKHGEQIKATMKTLTEVMPSLDLMVQAGVIKEIDLNYFQDETSIHPSLKLLSMSMNVSNQPQQVLALKTLGSAVIKAQELEAEFGVSVINKLDQKFLTAVENLNLLWTKIKNKNGKIKKLIIGYSSSYSDYSKELTIGYNSTLAETEKIIQSIK